MRALEFTPGEKSPVSIDWRHRLLAIDEARGVVSGTTTLSSAAWGVLDGATEVTIAGSPAPSIVDSTRAVAWIVAGSSAAGEEAVVSCTATISDGSTIPTFMLIRIGR